MTSRERAVCFGAFALVVLVVSISALVTTRMSSERETPWRGSRFPRPDAAAPSAEAGRARAPSRSAGETSAPYGATGLFRSGPRVRAPAPSDPSPRLTEVALGPAAAPVASALEDFHAMVMRETVRMRGIWFRAIERSPVVKAYVKDWRADPELKALTESWYLDHDPIAFVRGLAYKPQFYRLLGKHARSPDLLAVMKEDLDGASPHAMAELSKAIAHEPAAQEILDKATAATGVPLRSLIPGGQALPAAGAPGQRP